MTSIRERAGGAMIGVLVVAFGGLWALQDSGAFDTVGQGRDARTIGQVDGERIDGAQFNRLLQQQEQAYQQQGIPVSNTLRRQLEDQTFNQLVDAALVEREMDRFGIEVTDDEVFDLITGPTPDPLIAQIFSDGQGGVDRVALQQVVEDPIYATDLQAIEEQIRRTRRQAKLTALLTASVRASEAEVMDEFVRQNRQATAQFIALRYADIPDDQVEVTESDLEAYYRANRDDFERPASYSVEYVLFDRSPTAEDSARATRELADLVEAFEGAPDAAAFARRNSFGETIEPTFVGAGDMPAELSAAVFANPEAGRVVGPVVAGDQAILARITDARDADAPSIRARHILLPAGEEERAREIRARIESGDIPFEQAARQFSTDESNKARGGDLGWFGRGRMVAAFESAAFGAPVGRVVGPVATEFGVHLLRVEDRADREVEMVQISRPVEGDFDRVMEQAQDFEAFIELENQEFAEAAAEQGITPVQAQVTDDQAFIPGLEVGREFGRFLRGAREGAISEPLDAGTGFVVVRLLDTRDAGVAPLDEVRSQIESAVLLEKKREVQVARLGETLAGISSLSGLSQALDTEVQTQQEITLSNPTLTGYGVEPRAVGAIFGLQPGQRSGVVGGQNAAVVVRTVRRVGGTQAELT
ncbi:MAG: peptidyl-prolyl cis-trans isomerase, partial [Bacteroidota bacterium]